MHLLSQCVSVRQFVLTELLPILAWEDLNGVVNAWFKRHQKRWHATTDVLPCLACEAAGGRAEDAVALSGFWSLSFLASRIFDSVQDNEDHDQPWMARGSKFAISRGLSLIALANVSMTYSQADDNAHREITRAFSRMWALAAKSQADTQSDFSIEGYFANIIASTGEPFATAVWSGGRLVTDDSEILQSLTNYGLSAGIALAITSDCHGLWSDIAAGIYKLPVIYALSLPEFSRHSELQALLEKPVISVENVTQIMGILDEIQAVAWSMEIANQYRQRAVAALAPLPATNTQSLIDYVT
jgi:geranylgeranyl pyrophosphate synthase